MAEDRGHLITKAPKNGKPRIISLDKDTIEILRRQIEGYPSRDGLVFTSPKGYQIRHRNFMDDHFYPALKRLDCLPPGFRFHDLRHTHASILIAGGWRPEQVKDRLGHGSIRTTFDWYLHLFEGHATDQLKLLGTTIRSALASQPRQARVMPLSNRASGASYKGP